MAKMLIEVTPMMQNSIETILKEFNDNVTIISSYEPDEHPDHNKLRCIASVIGDVMNGDMPKPEDLDFDDDAIELYQNLSTTQAALKRCGYDY